MVSFEPNSFPMKTQYLFLTVLLCMGTFLFTGCTSIGYESSSVHTPEGEAVNKAIYLDLLGHGRQVYPPRVTESVPVYEQDTQSVPYVESYPAYGGTVDYSGGYYGRPVSVISYSPGYYVTRHAPEHHYGPVHVEPPHTQAPRIEPHVPYRPSIIYERPVTQVYTQSPYVLAPSGTTTVVRPTYGYGPPGHH
jgi:hypothetical protein